VKSSALAGGAFRLRAIISGAEIALLTAHSEADGATDNHRYRDDQDCPGEEEGEHGGRYLVAMPLRPWRLVESLPVQLSIRVRVNEIEAAPMRDTAHSPLADRFVLDLNLPREAFYKGPLVFHDP